MGYNQCCLALTITTLLQTWMRRSKSEPASQIKPNKTLRSTSNPHHNLNLKTLPLLPWNASRKDSSRRKKSMMRLKKPKTTNIPWRSSRISKGNMKRGGKMAWKSKKTSNWAFDKIKRLIRMCKRRKLSKKCRVVPILKERNKLEQAKSV